MCNDAIESADEKVTDADWRKNHRSSGWTFQGSLKKCNFFSPNCTQIFY